MYRNADYDKSDDACSTASFPTGLEEDWRFLPHAVPQVRRTSSCDDVSRCHRYFQLLKKSNPGRTFSWVQYAEILHDAFRSFKTPEPRSFPWIPRSDGSVYLTASETTLRRRETDSLTPKRVFRRLRLGSVNSITTDDEETSMSGLSTLSRASSSCIKKICNETKNLARDICTKVDKITQFQSRRKTREVHSSKKKKHLVRTVDSHGNTPISYKGNFSESVGTVDSTSCVSDSSSLLRTRTGAGDHGGRCRVFHRSKQSVDLGSLIT